MKRKVWHKFNATQTVSDGIKFQSNKEARYYDELKLQVAAGEVIGFFRQIPLHLPGGIIYRMDFFVFYANGTCEGVEVKGYETKEWKLKKKLIDECYPWLELKIV